MLCSAAALLSALNALEASMSSTASVSSDSNRLCIASIAASLPDFCPAHSGSEPLASTTSFFPTLITHFPQILLKTSPTPIGLTAPSPLSSGIRRLATRGSMVIGSMYCVHRVLVIVAIASHSLVDDCLKDLQARILLKPFASTPDRPPAPFVLKAACLTFSPLIHMYHKVASGYTVPRYHAFLYILSAPAYRTHSPHGPPFLPYFRTFCTKGILLCDQYEISYNLFSKLVPGRYISGPQYILSNFL